MVGFIVLTVPVDGMARFGITTTEQTGVQTIEGEERKCFIPSAEDENYHLIENVSDYIFFVNEDRWEDIYANVWRENNFPVDLKKKELRVLDIGNSYTVDATHYLKEIMRGCDIIPEDTWSAPADMALVCAIRSGGSWKNWYDTFHDHDTQSYTIYKVFGGLDIKLPEGDSGIFEQGDGSGFRELLRENVFDLILIHPMSSYAPYFERWEEKSDAGYLSKLIGVLRIYQPQASIGFLLVHSLASNDSRNVEGSSLERWSKIAESVRRVKEHNGIDFVIPYGTAIQNLRASHLNNYPDDLTQDGIHCASGIADYTAGCCYYQSLIAPRYGRSVMGSTARITNENLESEMAELEESGLSYNRESMIPVDDHTAEVAQMAAILATEDWYTVRNPDEFLTPSDSADSEDCKEVISKNNYETGENAVNAWRGTQLRHYKDNVYVWINFSGKRQRRILFNYEGGGEPNRTEPMEYVSRATYWPDGEIVMNPSDIERLKKPYIEFDRSDGSLLYAIDSEVKEANIEIISTDGCRLAHLPLTQTSAHIQSVPTPETTGLFIARLTVVDRDGNVSTATCKYIR